ncbi:hypothetical protein ALGA_2908 [Labilibaculum antarcticum]|uniref:Transcriptional regulator LacI/GalR-like sensor domain-containing protein n=2 Tax=Labilibaculum antarcticum TaxID=1717717 RepID=A0A1Y1CMG4_9BACT|nr:hypothetical protein ALGA_2908 [Labilibaculum antarcticum]
MSRHQVSRETAKRVLKALIDENLVVSQAGRGTFINTATTLIKKWGMVIPFYSSNIEQLISQINIHAQASGRKLEYFLHYNNPDEEMRSIGQLIQKGYEAIIVVPNYDESITGEFYRKVHPGKTKIVLADNTMAGSYFEYAIQSYDLGVKRAVDYLTETEKGNYLLLSNEKWQGRNLVFEMMKQTFEMILDLKYPDRKLFLSSDIMELTSEFFTKNKIKGILTIQDSIAVRLIGRLQKWGFKIPEDLKLVSYGNTELSELFTPSITVVDCKYGEMALRITQLIKNDPDLSGKQVVVQPNLIIRET